MFLRRRDAHTIFGLLPVSVHHKQTDNTDAMRQGHAHSTWAKPMADYFDGYWATNQISQGGAAPPGGLRTTAAEHTRRCPNRHMVSIWSPERPAVHARDAVARACTAPAGPVPGSRSAEPRAGHKAARAAGRVWNNHQGVCLHIDCLTAFAEPGYEPLPKTGGELLVIVLHHKSVLQTWH